MASINGVELKNLKKFKGTNESIYLKGDVYIDGCKVGFWSECENSLNDYFDFDTTELKKRKETFECPNYNIDLEDFMEILVDLKGFEKDVKKYIKEGYSSVEIVKGWFKTADPKDEIQRLQTYCVACDGFDGLDKESRKEFLKKYFNGAENIASLVVSKLDDLDFVINASDEVPNFLK